MSSAQASSAFSADAPRYGAEAAAAYYALHDVNGSTGVDSIDVSGTKLSGDVALNAGTGIVLTPAGNGVTITASGAGVASVAGTANQITATTASGAVTLALAAPSPAPTAGSYTSANITVDALGRVTAAASGAGPLANVLYFDLSGGNIPLPTGPSTTTSKLMPTLGGLTSGKAYYMSLVLFVGFDAGGPTGFSTASTMRFTFTTDAPSGAAPPRVFPGTNASYALTQLQELTFSIMSLGSTGSSGGKAYSINWSGIIVAQSTALRLVCNNTSSTDVGGNPALICGNLGGLQSFVQLQQLD
jgi:hypothetical protein